MRPPISLEAPPGYGHQRSCVRTRHEIPQSGHVERHANQSSKPPAGRSPSMTTRQIKELTARNWAGKRRE
jgi:hypothetical protein